MGCLHTEPVVVVVVFVVVGVTAAAVVVSSSRRKVEYTLFCKLIHVYCILVTLQGFIQNRRK
jgi:hypothetical protein